MRLHMSTALRTTTWMADVVTAGNVSLRQTLLLPRTAPPGTSTQVEPFQYSTSKSMMPYCVNVIPSVGVDGLV